VPGSVFADMEASVEPGVTELNGTMLDVAAAAAGEEGFEDGTNRAVGWRGERVLVRD